MNTVKLCVKCGKNPRRDDEVFWWCQKCMDKFNERVKGLRCVRALFECGPKKVKDVYIVNNNPNLLIANTDGYDDWGHVIKYSPGEFNRERYDYIDCGRY